jgi:site-specific DNA-methyltransferase (adenine-specific)
MSSTINLYNCDCMEFMKGKPDKYYDLAIVDPPYGIGCDGNKASTGGHGGRKAHLIKEWDNSRPNKNYFDGLFKVSKDQIIWGANYYPEYLHGTMGWIFWDKGQDINQSDGELAFTSFNIAFRRKVINRVELLKEGTIHPTQKPIRLYKWLLKNYAKEGDKILDTHGGSMSIALACWEMGFDLDLCEIDKDYFEDGKKRFENFKRQGLLFI